MTSHTFATRKSRVGRGNKEFDVCPECGFRHDLFQSHITGSMNPEGFYSYKYGNMAKPLDWPEMELTNG